MCKYCEEMDIKPVGDKIFYKRNGGAGLVFDAEEVGWLLDVSDSYTYPVEYCPWCGRDLDPPADEELEFSAEEELARLESRINHTNDMLRRLTDSMGRMLEWPNPDMRFEQLANLKDIRGKI